MEGIWAEPLNCYITVVRSHNRIHRISFSSRSPEEPSEVAAALFGYLLGGPRPKVELDMEGISSFQKEVYTKVSTIPRGNTMTYSQVAALCNKPAAARAVGQALAKNPFPIMVPCHRVVSREGLGGFSYGLELKRRLLLLEQRPRNVLQ
jgi:O-6-methylguanine DNA methyltransferase